MLSIDVQMRIPVLFPTEAEFLDIAQKLKPHVERRMKIEPFPWLRDYYVHIDELYTELILEKIENKLLGWKTWTLEGYVEMFDCEGQNKILIKGDPGIGKTTLGKKIGWDWAKGLFKMFSIIFFVFLKFVQPGDLIENVIIKQNPELGISAEKLRDILDRFGDRCLLILDGLDEHGLGKNEDVLRIIRNEILGKCGIVVSSRPHSTSGIEIHFSAIVRVDGFNKMEAWKFASNFLKNGNKIRQVLRFRPSDSRENVSIWQCPILLSFFCFLVAEEKVDLSDETLDVGDIYTRLVKRLYKKYMLRKGKEFEMDGFLSVMKSVGELAIKTLATNNPLLRRNEVGEFAFEYGLFAGHEDFRLATDPTADICVTYPHRSLEEFFGSFGFLQALNDGKSVDDILGSDCKKPLFMMNPLVLKFCLWFLSSKDFDFPQKDEIYDKLTSCVAQFFDTKVLNTKETFHTYPAIDLLQSDHSTMEFFCDILKKCKHVTTLHAKRYDHRIEFKDVQRLFALMNREIIDTLRNIIVGEDFRKLTHVDNDSLTLSIDHFYDDALKVMNMLLCDNNLAQKNPEILLRIAMSTTCDITPLLSEYIKELYISCDEQGLAGHLLKVSGEFPYCPNSHILASSAATLMIQSLQL